MRATYNRYIPDAEAQIPVDRPSSKTGGPSPGPGKVTGLLSGLLGRGVGEENRASQALSGLLKSLHLEHLDTGDILLGLIVLFLVLEDGDDLDLIITLGLTILLSLGEP